MLFRSSHGPSQVCLVQSMFSQDEKGLLSNSEFWVALLEGLLLLLIFVFVLRHLS